MNTFRLIIAALGLMLALPGFSRQPQRGYRGFLVWASSVRQQKALGTPEKTNTLFFTGFSTSHGYQFNEMWYLGAGIELESVCNSGVDDDLFAIFLDGRADFKFGAVTPFADVRVGYNTLETDFYLSPTIGYRFNWGRRIGINVGVGATLRRIKTDDFSLVESTGNKWVYHTDGPRHKVEGMFTFRIGVDF